jgi:hypothetical protein
VLAGPNKTKLTGLSPLTFAIELSLDGAEPEVAKTVLLELDVARNNHINVVAVPLFHLDDAPVAEERIGALGCHDAMSIRVRPDDSS